MPNIRGANAEDVPATGELGRMAFQSPGTLVIEPQGTATPQRPGDMAFQLTNDTSLAIRVRGLDGVLRSATLTLT